ncbi:MAG: glycosyltransferase family 2 protein [Verrucomicrobia bacterium]|nr:glycosyltransferase family 2 protein [Verrucomicrobiota bacterium]
MSNPLVSVLMTAYNREQYIAEAIESVLAQTFTDFELIVVDDGSKDRSVEIARRYASDQRVRLFVNEINLGQFQNRNRAAKLARGKYLKYLDADDMLYPHCLDVMTHQMEMFPQAGLGFANQPREEWAYPVALGPRDAYRLNFLGSGGLGHGPTFAIVRKDTFWEVGGFPVMHLSSDMEFNLTVARRHQILFTIQGLVFYRYHAGQQEGGVLIERGWWCRTIGAQAESFRILRDALLHPNCPLSESERTLAMRNLVGIHLRLLARYILRGWLKDAVALWRLSNCELEDMRWALSPSRFPYATAMGNIEPRTVAPNWKAYPHIEKPGGIETKSHEPS